MLHAHNVLITPEEYLKREREADTKSEYFQGEVFMMAGASRNHNRVKDNLGGEFYSFLKTKPCQYFSSDMRLHIPENTLFTYPDLMIVCGKVEMTDDEQDTIKNPVVIVEVLSKSTAGYDRGDKFELYRKITSFKEYVLVDSRRVKAEVWRKNESDVWTLAQELASIDDILEIAAIGQQIPLRDVYAGTEGILTKT